MPWRAGRCDPVKLLRELLSFGIVGIAATLAHVLLAWLLIDLFRCNPYVANLMGTIAAFSISFLGNAGFTFQTNRTLQSSAIRYVFVSLTSFILTTGVLAGTRYLGLPTHIYVLVVLATVPPATFLLAKLWAFSPQLSGSKE